MENTKKCPFNHEECSEECALYLSPDELNELVKNKLTSIGVLHRDKGMCALKNMSLCASRHIFENTITSTFSR